jgi:hypothetical protein
MLERSISWHEESYAVRTAYQRWADSDCREQRLAYAGYLAALDREERAARTYAGHVERVTRIAASLWHGQPSPVLLGPSASRPFSQPRPTSI